MAHPKFKSHVERYVDSVDFLKLYNEIEEDNTYVPNKLIELIRMCMYYLEIKNKLDGVQLCLLYYLNVLNQEHETKKEFAKLELLYIIQKLDEVITKSKGTSPTIQLYM